MRYWAASIGALPSRDRDTTIPIYSVPVRPHLEYYIQFRSPKLKSNTERQGMVQKRAASVPCEERLEVVNSLLPGEENGQERHHGSFSVPKRHPQKGWRHSSQGATWRREMAVSESRQEIFLFNRIKTFFAVRSFTGKMNCLEMWWRPHHWMFSRCDWTEC